MFDFLVKRQIDDLLTRAYQSNYGAYKAGLQDLLRQADSGGFTEAAFYRLLAAARERYVFAVSETVYGAVAAAHPKTAARYQLAIRSPALAGAPMEDDTPYCAGIEYCFLCYAFTGKPGAPKDAIRHNHLFASYVDRAVDELTAEHTAGWI